MNWGRESRARPGTHDSARTSHKRRVCRCRSETSERQAVTTRTSARKARCGRRLRGGASRGAGWCSSSSRGSQGLVRVRWTMLRADDGGFGAYLLNQAAACWDQRIWVRGPTWAGSALLGLTDHPSPSVGRPPKCSRNSAGVNISGACAPAVRAVRRAGRAAGTPAHRRRSAA